MCLIICHNHFIISFAFDANQTQRNGNISTTSDMKMKGQQPSAIGDRELEYFYCFVYDAIILFEKADDESYA